MKNKNKKILRDFIEYCNKHKTQRFWQALRNWSSYNFILGSKESSILDIDIMTLEDTYYKEKK